MLNAKWWRTVRTITLIAIAIVVAIATVSWCTVWHTSESFAASSSRSESHWRDEIRRVGPDAAYKEFAAAIHNLQPFEQHTQAHVFGAALYLERGLDGVSTCDDQFGDGCSHELIGRAVAANGIGVVEQLSEACTRAAAPRSYLCPHGIGHGLMTFFGDTEEGLRKSLPYCDAHAAEDPLNGCYSGAFMEYFERNVATGDDSPRPVENGNIFSVCPQYGGTAEWICYFSLPRWWHQLEKHQNISEDAIFPVVLSRCLEVRGKMRDVCLDGIGQMIPSTVDYDPARAIARCAEISSDATEIARCRAYAANDFLMERSEEEALPVCTGLTGTALTYCRAFATTPVQKDIRLTL